MAQTAAIVLIGNELLSGKIRDENAAFLAERLYGLGVTLRRIAVVPDERDAIVDEVRRCVAACDVVFTSGGVGPTHDDITLESIAFAFDVPVVRHAALQAVLTEHFGQRLREAHLRMADLPEGAELIDEGEIRWPVIKMRSVYVLPGIPQLFRAKFDAIATRFGGGRFHLRSVYLNADEGTIAEQLQALEGDHGVVVGSYPRWDDPDHKLRVTIEARDPARVDAAVAALVAGLESARVVRVDEPAT